MRCDSSTPTAPHPKPSEPPPCPPSPPASAVNVEASSLVLHASDDGDSAVDILRESFNLVSNAMNIAPMPSQVSKGEGASAAYTGNN